MNLNAILNLIGKHLQKWKKHTKIQKVLKTLKKSPASSVTKLFQYAINTNEYRFEYDRDKDGKHKNEYDP